VGRRSGVCVYALHWYLLGFQAYERLAKDKSVLEHEPTKSIKMNSSDVDATDNK
jgi:hypothetical protein